jgi:hypothetical protein
MNNMYYRILFSILIATVFLTGCTEATLMSAKNLSLVGQSASTQAGNNAILSPSGFNLYQDSVAFQAGLAGGTPDPAETILANEVQQELVKRAAVFESLSSAYAALGNLASYDASGNFNTAFGSLVKDVNSYLNVVQKSPINPGATSLIQSFGTIFIGLAQKHEIIVASKNLRVPLDGMINALSDPLVKTQYYTFQQKATNNIGNTVRYLYHKKIYQTGNILDGFGQVYGLKTGSNLDQILSQKGNENIFVGFEGCDSN